MTRRRGHKRAKRVTHDPKPTVRLRAYAIVADAVESGVARGWMRAYKYDAKPIPENGPRAMHAREEIADAVTTALCEVMDFAPFEEEDGEA